jgi:large subunit ribosomal protein L10
MPSQQNIDALQELKDKAAKAKAIALTDYLGLSVAQLSQLRDKVRQVGGELRVTKNTLLKLAFADAGFPKEIETALEGPTLTLFAYEDEVAPLKAIVEFARENEIPTLKAGFLGKEFLRLERLQALAALPSREQLHAQVVGQLSAPIYGFVNVLFANLRSLVYVLQSIGEKKN